METVTISEFARRMGVDEKLIRRAIENGGISATKNGRKVSIDFEKAKQEFEDLGMGMKKFSDEEKSHLQNLNVDNSSYKESKRREAYFKSEISRMEMEEKAGTLVNKQDVYNELFDFGSEVKNRILSIPDRITDELITLSGNRSDFYNKLYSAINEELLKLSEGGKI